MNSLTTEQLDALLHEPGQTNTDAELTSLRATLSDLRTASIAIAEHHHQHARIVPMRTNMPRIWTFATAALVLCAAATPVALHHRAAPVTPIAVVTQQPTATVSDDVLFANVQADLDASVPSPLLPLSTDTTTKSNTTKDTQ